MILKIKKLSDNVKIPAYQSAGAACFDIHSSSDGVVAPCESKVFDTGLVFEIPTGYALLIYSRSGHGFKDDVRLANCVGVIDSDYRGEVKVKLTNDGPHLFTVDKGDRIAQAMLVAVPKVELLEVEELSDTVRGDGGFGSTGGY